MDCPNGMKCTKKRRCTNSCSRNDDCVRVRKNSEGLKSGLAGSELDSQSNGRGFESHPIVDGNGVKAMPGLFPVHPTCMIKIEIG